MKAKVLTTGLNARLDRHLIDIRGMTEERQRLSAGAELLSDLTVYCDSCHLEEHNLKQPVREIINIL